MFFRTPYNYDTDVASFLSGLDCSKDVSLTQQNFADQLDINKMVKTFAKTGEIPGMDLPAMRFEYDEIFDFQSAMNAINATKAAFMRLPSHTREYFHNDPHMLAQFLSDPANETRARELGLMNPAPKGAIVKSSVPDPVPSAPPAPADGA